MEEQKEMRLEERKAAVRRCFAQVLMRGEEEIGDRDDFLADLGGDSLDILDAVVELERITGLTIPEEEYTRCRCVEDVAALLCRLEAGEKTEPAGREQEAAPRRWITRFEDTPEYAELQARLGTIEEGRNPYFVAYESPLRNVG